MIGSPTCTTLQMHVTSRILEIRMMRDLFTAGCNSNSARDKIIQKGEKITLKEVIEYLQIENSTHQTLQEMNSTTQKVHYASYDKKKSKDKKKAPIASSSTRLLCYPGSILYQTSLE